MTLAPEARALAHGLFAAAMGYAAFAVFALNIDTADHRDEALAALAGIAGAVPLLIAAWLLRHALRDAAGAAVAMLARVPPRRLAAAAWLAGVALRLAWIAAVPPVQVSDGASYHALAVKLAAGAEYAAAGTRAYWPPGLPLALAAWILAFGDRWILPLLHNLVLFSITLWAARRLARRLAGEPAAAIAAILLALWPSHVMSAGLATKELQVLALVTLALALYPTRARGGHALCAGIAFGLATLTQPALLLAPTAFLAFEALRASSWRGATLRSLCFLAGFAAAIAPWTVRNAAVFGSFVPITSTSGFALFIANSERAWGGWIDVAAIGDPALDHSRDELGASREALRRAREWIAANPARAAGLALRKQQLFLGDDSDGAFNALKRGLGVDGVPYVAAKLVAIAYWLAIAVATPVFLAAAWYARRGRLPSLATLPILLFFYLFCLHSLVESGSRHRIALAGAQVALLGAWIEIAARRHAR
jgi:4-amino-4-deoxy-L-arabinose transferase-like glycosyltransferase